MGQRLVQKYCNTCGKPTAHMQQRPNHILHLILSIVTAGLWLIPWAIMSLNHKTPRCSVCGQKAGKSAPVTRTQSVSNTSAATAPSPSFGGASAPYLAGTDTLEVVGEQFCREVHMTLFGDATGKREAKCALVRMADNPADPNAIGVFVVERNGAINRRVGYLSRDVAATYASTLDAAGGTVLCNAAFFRDDNSHVWSTDALVDVSQLT